MLLNQDLRFCVAPMMDWTDRHCRYFHRILSRRARLYTEMLAVGAVLHGDRARLLRFDAAEHPVALQLGGSKPVELAAAARIGADYGFDEINLNIGCPSGRVQSGAFGACLMREPELVGECVAAIKARVKIPVTVKCRTGVDEQDPETALGRLAERVVAAGCDALIVHARKAWLKGLSPKDNRNVPPLDYGLVRALKQRFPKVPVVLNGGLSTLAEMRAELDHVDGGDGGARRLSEPGAAPRCRCGAFRRGSPRRPGRGGRGFHSLCRGAACRRRSASCDDATSPGAFQWLPRCSRVAAGSRGGGGETRRGHAALCARPCSMWTGRAASARRHEHGLLKNRPRGSIFGKRSCHLAVDP